MINHICSNYNIFDLILGHARSHHPSQLINIFLKYYSSSILICTSTKSLRESLIKLKSDCLTMLLQCYIVLYYTYSNVWRTSCSSPPESQFLSLACRLPAGLWPVPASELCPQWGQHSGPRQGKHHSELSGQVGQAIRRCSHLSAKCPAGVWWLLTVVTSLTTRTSASSSSPVWSQNTVQTVSVAPPTLPSHLVHGHHNHQPPPPPQQQQQQRVGSARSI